MADLFPVAGAKLYLGTAAMTVPTIDVVAADFASVSWTPIADWQNMGAIGDQAAEITTDLIDRKRTVVQKGTRRSPAMANSFAVNADDPGQLALVAAEATSLNYPFRILFDDIPAAVATTVTMTIAAPGVITWTGHPFAVGNRVVFTTTGALPTGLVAGTTYYVKTVLDADTFTVSATSGGTAITTSGTQSGVHTGTSVPNATEKFFIGLVQSAQEQGGAANSTRLLSASVSPNTNIVTVARAPNS